MPRLRTHPGEALAEVYLEPLGLSASALAEAIGVLDNRIDEIVRRRRAGAGAGSLTGADSATKFEGAGR
jgi:addiction module HigA family antidote